MSPGEVLMSGLEFDVESISVRKGCSLNVYTGTFYMYCLKNVILSKVQTCWKWLICWILLTNRFIHYAYKSVITYASNCFLPIF